MWIRGAGRAAGAGGFPAAGAGGFPAAGGTGGSARHGRAKVGGRTGGLGRTVGPGTVRPAWIGGFLRPVPPCRPGGHLRAVRPARIRRTSYVRGPGWVRELGITWRHGTNGPARRVARPRRPQGTGVVPPTGVTSPVHAAFLMRMARSDPCAICGGLDDFPDRLGFRLRGRRPWRSLSGRGRWTRREIGKLPQRWPLGLARRRLPRRARFLWAHLRVGGSRGRRSRRLRCIGRLTAILPSAPAQLQGECQREQEQEPGAPDERVTDQ